MSKILFVDDEDDLETMLKQRFRKELANDEYEFEFARNGAEALEKLKDPDAIDVVFTDINMPVMDGITFLSHLNKKKDLITQAIVVSAYGDMENIRKAMNEGAIDFITKPIDFHDLEVTMAKSLEMAKANRRSKVIEERLKVALVEKEKAEQSRKFKQQFLANMSHEIRTPLNAIAGMTELLIDSELDPKQKKYLSAIRHSSHNLVSLVNDILDISKIEAGRIEIENSPFSLAQTIEGIYDLFSLKAKEKGLDLSIHFDAGIPEAVLGDSVRLNQVLINLAGNAIKFTPSGSVAVSCTVEKSSATSIEVQFSVKDSGIGIRKEKQKVIFEVFSQEGLDTTRKFGGTGLGLTISQQLVELMGGKLQVQSSPGDGAEFFFTLSFDIADGKTLPQYEHISLPEIPDGLKGYRILLTEDNAYNQIVAEEILKKLIPNVSIMVAGTGNEALKLLHEYSFDLVLMDLQMPELDGYETTRLIRKQVQGASANIPIIAFTAGVSAEDQQKCKAVGMNGYISKPFVPATLLQEIIRVTGLATSGSSGNADSTVVILPQDQGEWKRANLQFLRTITGNEEEEIKKFVTLFLDIAPITLEKMNAAIEQNDSQKLGLSAHSFKSKVKYVGMDSLVPYLERLEESKHTELNRTEIDELILKFTEGLSEGISELTAYMNDTDVTAI